MNSCGFIPPRLFIVGILSVKSKTVSNAPIAFAKIANVPAKRAIVKPIFKVKMNSTKPKKPKIKKM